jgi:hypothetical protein
VTDAPSSQTESVTTRVALLVGVQDVEHHTSICDTPSIFVRSESVPEPQQAAGGLAFNVVESSGV